MTSASTGAAIRLIGDGDVAGGDRALHARRATWTSTWACGGSPEAVLAAAAIRCLGGEMLAADVAARRGGAEGRLDRRRPRGRCSGPHLHGAEDMARGDDVVFAATGMTDNPLCCTACGSTSRSRRRISVVMRAHSRTVRYVKAFHDLTRKTIRLHSRGRDTTL
jgi:fructose-1,6-bisphosphatase II / sedoheptulose-1,7-bisphosphatase